MQVAQLRQCTQGLAFHLLRPGDCCLGITHDGPPWRGQAPQAFAFLAQLTQMAASREACFLRDPPALGSGGNLNQETVAHLVSPGSSCRAVGQRCESMALCARAQRRLCSSGPACSRTVASVGCMNHSLSTSKAVRSEITHHVNCLCQRFVKICVNFSRAAVHYPSRLIRVGKKKPPQGRLGRDRE